MLEADNIIQQKEWAELTAEELQAIATLADDETEFNLLKQMLLVSSQAPGNVPMVHPTVRSQISAALPKHKKKAGMYYWYAAAAAVIAIVVSAVFILNKQEQAVYVSTPPATINERAPELISPKKDSSQHIVRSNSRQARPSVSLPHNQPPFRDLADSIPGHADYIAAVGDDPALLEFITEVE